MAQHEFRVIQGCPCPKNVAPYIAIVVNDAKATVNSIYRGTDAQKILNAHGHSTQAQLYAAFLAGHGNPANPPGFSTHELKSDGAAYPSVPRGHDLPWWGQGFDVNDWETNAVIAQAAAHGWELWRPYPTGSEFHHLNFRKEPKPTPHTKDRIVRLRNTLPRS